MDKTKLSDEIKTLLDQTLAETKTKFQIDTAALAMYAAEQTAQLTSLVGQPGFEKAAQATRDNILMKGAIMAGKQAVANDGRLIGVIQSVLFFGARRLAGI